MLWNWLLLVILLPGWLVPSGVRVPVCACRIAPAEVRSCCAPEPERRSCCAAESSTDVEESGATDEAGARLRRSKTCDCSLAVPDHAGGRAIATVAQPAQLAPAQRPLPRVEPPAAARAAIRLDRDRPRGPSPGGSNPLPLRL